KRRPAPGNRWPAPGRHYTAKEKRCAAPGGHFTATERPCAAPGRHSTAPERRCTGPGERCSARENGPAATCSTPISPTTMSLSKPSPPATLPRRHNTTDEPATARPRPPSSPGRYASLPRTASSAPSPIRSAPSEPTACPGSRETARACHHLKPPALLGSELHARHHPPFVAAELSVRSMIKSVASNTACLDALGGGPIMECCPPLHRMLTRFTHRSMRTPYRSTSDGTTRCR